MVQVVCPKCGFAMMYSLQKDVCVCGEPLQDETCKCLKCGYKIVVDRRGFIRTVG